MNKILFTSLLSTLLFTNVNAQMIIAEDNNYPTGMVTESSLLQFEEGRSRGIILPANDVAPQNPANGTFVFDMSDIKIKMYENDQWINLTDRGNTQLVTMKTMLARVLLLEQKRQKLKVF